MWPLHIVKLCCIISEYFFSSPEVVHFCYAFPFFIVSLFGTVCQVRLDGVFLDLSSSAVQFVLHLEFEVCQCCFAFIFLKNLLI